MKTNRLLLVGALALSVSPSFARDEAALAAAQREQLAAVALGQVELRARPEWLNNKISVDFKDVTIQAAMKTVLEKLDVRRFEIHLDGRGPVYSTAHPDAPSNEESLKRPFADAVTLKLDSVSGEEVCKKLAEKTGVRFAFREEDGSVTVSIAKTPRAIKVYTIGSPEVLVDTTVRQALSVAQDAVNNVQPFLADVIKQGAAAGSGFSYSVPGTPMPPIAIAPLGTTTPGPSLPFIQISTPLPPRSIRLDVRNKDAREILKDILKQAKLDYALEEDLPEEKASLSLQNVSTEMALTMACRVLRVGWRAETVNKKVIVRVGRKYLGWSPASDSPFDAPNLYFAPGTTTILPVAPPPPASAPTEPAPPAKPEDESAEVVEA